MLTDILDGIDNIFIYIDDIIIYNQDEKSHEHTIIKVLDKLIEFRVQLNFEKCKFELEEIKILGYIVNNIGIRSDVRYLNNKCLDIKPSNKKELQKIIGVINWYRLFVPKISEKLEQITSLLKNTKEKLNFTDAHQKALKDVINEIKDDKVIKFPDFSKKFILQCDASQNRIGSVLYQDHGVIAYYSAKFKESEINYSVVEKELYAIVRSLMFFKYIIYGYYVEVLLITKIVFILIKRYQIEWSDGKFF